MISTVLHVVVMKKTLCYQSINHQQVGDKDFSDNKNYISLSGAIFSLQDKLVKDLKKIFEYKKQSSGPRIYEGLKKLFKTSQTNKLL